MYTYVRQIQQDDEKYTTMTNSPFCMPAAITKVVAKIIRPRVGTYLFGKPMISIRVKVPPIPSYSVFFSSRIQQRQIIFVRNSNRAQVSVVCVCPTVLRALHSRSNLPEQSCALGYTHFAQHSTLMLTIFILVRVVVKPMCTYTHNKLSAQFPSRHVHIGFYYYFFFSNCVPSNFDGGGEIEVFYRFANRIFAVKPSHKVLSVCTIQI